MIVLRCKQGSPEWHLARLGIPTASQFHRLMTPKTRKLGAGAETYMHELLAEWLTGMPCGPEARGLIERGSSMEPWAAGFYHFVRDRKVEPVGVCLRDDRMVACSPDGLVDEDGGLEVKTPSAPQHVENLLDMGDRYFAQAQGCMWITDRKWWDLLSYHPELPPALVRIERDPEFIADLQAAVGSFLLNLAAARKKLLDLGCVPAEGLDPEFAEALAALPVAVSSEEIAAAEAKRAVVLPEDPA